MAIRLQRVLIACGLPTILAIVSFYWLRKRRKAVTHSSSPPKQAINTIDKSFDSIKSAEKLENISLNQSQTICDSHQIPTDYTMQLRDNNNCSPASNASNACDTTSDTNRENFTSDKTNSTDNQIESNNSKNSLGFKHQMNSQNNDINEYNCKYSDISEDKVVVKLSNISFEDENNCDSHRIETEYTLQLRDDHNCSNSTNASPHPCDTSSSSSDSGKGGSDILHVNSCEGPNHTDPIDDSVIYQFEIPQYLCGRLIGSGGRFVSLIKRNTNTVVVINRHLYRSDMKICTLTGTKSEIKEALNIIRNRFPIEDYSNVSLQQINLINATQTCSLPQTCQLQLPSGITCDVILSSLVSAGHFFLQQPTHPTYPSLSRLDHHMMTTYSHQNTPLLPNIHTGMICAVPIMGGWYRAVITQVYESEECDVMFVDYGGYTRLPVSSLRQIRYDFMSLPFQASECYLANVEPIDTEIGWTAEANALFEELAQGQILQALIVGYSDSGIPLVHLFKIQGISNVFINQELVNQCHAQWIDTCTSA